MQQKTCKMSFQQKMAALDAVISEKGEKCRKWFMEKNWKDSGILLVLSGVYFLCRFLSLEEISSSGDNVWKWRFLRFFHETGIWFPAMADHHQGRWSQNLPILWLMDLFPAYNPWAYYLFPVLCGLGFLILCYLITRKYADQFPASLVFLFLIFLSTFVEESCQPLPSLPAATFVLLALYFLICYVDAPEKLFYPPLAGLAMGLAWGSKVTVVYWCIGIGLFLCFHNVSRKNLLTWKKFHVGWDVILFSGVFFSVLALETLCINRFFHVPYGRISMLYQHTGINPEHIVCGLWEYLFSFIIVPLFPKQGKWYDLLPRMFLFLLSMSIYGMILVRGGESLRKRFLAFVFFVALLLHCYVVVHVFPFKHPERSLTRYYLILQAVGTIGLFAFWSEFMGFLRKRHVLLPWAAALCFLLLAIPQALAAINETFGHNDDIFCVLQNHRNAKIQKEKNLPVIVRFQKGGRHSKTKKIAMAWLAMYGETEWMPFLDNLAENPETLGADGKRYMQIAGPEIKPMTSAECLVLEKQETFIREMSFPTGSKPVKLK